MAGEIWRSTAQVGLQPTSTPVPATRKVYWTEPALTVERAATPFRPATGTRDNVRGVTFGPLAPAGSLSLPLSAEECLEVLLMAVRGGVTPTTPSGAVNGRLWTFTPGPLDQATIEWDDGTRVHQGAGYRVNSLTIAGAVDQDTTFQADLFGAGLIVGTLTPALTDRTPTFIQGWQTRLFVDTLLTGTPGATLVSDLLTNWSVTLNNNLDRAYVAANTQQANRTTEGTLDVTASFTFDAAYASALAELNAWDNNTGRIIRLEFQDETRFLGTGGDATLRPFITIDIPGFYTTKNLGASGAGTRRYEMGYQATYQATMGAMLKIRVQNARSAAW